MKNSLCLLIFVPAFAFCQEQTNFVFGHGPRETAPIKRSSVDKAQLATELVADYPGDYYNTIIDYVAVNITAICSEKTVTVKGSTEKLNEEQKQLLISSNYDTRVIIEIQFKYKDPANDNLGSGRKIKEMKYERVICPDVPAEFPGGNAEMNKFLEENFTDKLAKTSTEQHYFKLGVSFSVNEEGRTGDTKISRSSGDPAIDALLLKAIQSMPGWKPAENDKGQKVKQTIKLGFPVRGTGC